MQVPESPRRTARESTSPKELLLDGHERVEEAADRLDAVVSKFPSLHEYVGAYLGQRDYLNPSLLVVEGPA